MEKEIVQLLNQQINMNLQSAYMYLQFALMFDTQGLQGYSNYFRIQSKEKIDQGMLVYDYLIDKKEKIKLKTIVEYQEDISDICQCLQLALDKEKAIGKFVNEIYTASFRKQDYETTTFLQWFIIQQQEEVKNAQRMIDEFKLFSDSYYLLDKKYRERIYA